MSLSITVVTPSFNQGRFIGRTILSVIHQQIPNLEYLIVDGGSVDETHQELKRYENGLRWISEPDEGQADAINKALRMTSGDIIGWLNSDDIYYPDAIKKALSVFNKHPKIDVVYGDAYEIDVNDQVIAKYPTEKWSLNNLKKRCFISQPAVFFRRNLINKLGLLDKKLNYCMDYEFWLRSALAGASFYYLAETLAGTRTYPETKTSSAPLAFNIETMTMLRDKLGYVPQEWLINHAMLRIKANTQLRFLSFRFKVLALFSAIYFGLRWNGIFISIINAIMLPKTALQMLCYKRQSSLRRQVSSKT